MSDNKHTPEPWTLWADNNGCFRVGPSSNYTVAQIFHTPGVDSHDDNARRIVACVNACAGISQQYLEELNGETLADKQMVLITQRDEYSLLAYRRQNILDEVIKQRDELLAALEKCRKELSAWMRDHGDDIATQEAVADARAAIASVKGEQ